MNIEVLLTETEIAEELAESVEARDLPEKFFYWTPLSINSWKALSARSEEACARHGKAWPRRRPTSRVVSRHDSRDQFRRG